MEKPKNINKVQQHSHIVKKQWPDQCDIMLYCCDLFLKQEARRLWSEISTGNYCFCKREKYAEYVATISKEDLILFYQTFVSATSQKRRKFSSQYFGAGTKYPSQASTAAQTTSAEPQAKKTVLISDPSSFKRSSPLRPVQIFDSAVPIVEIPLQTSVFVMSYLALTAVTNQFVGWREACCWQFRHIGRIACHANNKEEILVFYFGS